ncbi:MAG: TIGR04282 family arsenosugar biosynthesis glycosyltransferase [Pseudomonadota bacterium]
MLKTSAIVVFAKAPQPGHVKTRLIPALGADGAARLAEELLAITMRSVLASDASRIVLAQSPAPSNALWRDVSLPATIERWDQGDGDLGERLLRSAAQALAHYDRVLLIGTDAPGLTVEKLNAAIAALEHHDAVLTPAFDGGYALLGLTRFERRVFEGIRWSTATVATETLQRLSATGFDTLVTAPVHDIDEPSDLDQLPAEMRLAISATT